MTWMVNKPDIERQPNSMIENAGGSRLQIAANDHQFILFLGRTISRDEYEQESQALARYFEILRIWAGKAKHDEAEENA